MCICVFKNVCVRARLCVGIIYEKKSMNLKESKEKYMEVFRERGGKGK